MQSNTDDNTNSATNSAANNTRPVSIFIKEAYTELRYPYLVYTDWTIDQMMDALAPQLARDFNLERDPHQLFPRAILIPFGQAGVYQAAEEGYDCSSFLGLKLNQMWDETLLETNIGFYLKRFEVIDLTNED